MARLLDDAELEAYLPKAGEEKELTLKEVSAPAGYAIDETEYTVKLTASEEEALKDGVFVTTTTYGITISNESEIDVTNVYSASGEGEIKVKKELEGRKWTNDDSFTFTISADEGTPLPENDSITIKKSDKNQTKSFGKIEFTKAGTYTYTISEIKGSLGGVTYDTTDHTVTIKVKDLGNGKLAGDGCDLIQTEEFTNTYQADSEFGEILVQKELKGREWKDSDEFEFTLSASENAPMPEEDTIVINKSDKDHIKGFGTIEFDKPGKYTYTVREVKGDAKGMKYDTKKHKVTFEINDDGNGNLVVKGGDDIIRTVKVTNTFSNNTSVDTGDTNDILLYSATLISSLLILLIMLIIRRRKGRA